MMSDICKENIPPKSPSVKRSSRKGKSASLRRRDRRDSRDRHRHDDYEISISNILKHCGSDPNVADIVQKYDEIDSRAGSRRSSIKDPEPMDRSRRSNSLCRVTGLSHSLDEPHYFPSKSDFPYFGRRGSCHITLGHVLGDDYHFPLFDPNKHRPPEEPDVQTNGMIPNGNCETKKLKRPLLKNDLIENPTKLLKEKFKKRKFPSEESGDQNGEKEVKPTEVKRKTSMPVLQSQKSREFYSNSDDNVPVDVNNNMVTEDASDLLHSASVQSKVGGEAVLHGFKFPVVNQCFKQLLFYRGKSTKRFSITNHHEAPPTKSASKKANK